MAPTSIDTSSSCSDLFLTLSRGIQKMSIKRASPDYAPELTGMAQVTDLM